MVVNSMKFCWSHLYQITNYFANTKIVHEYNVKIFTYGQFKAKISSFILGVFCRLSSASNCMLIIHVNLLKADEINEKVEF